MANEEKRQIVHILLFLFAFFLKYLGRFQAAFLLVLLFLIVVLVVPRLKIKSHFYRPTEGYYSPGAFLYFLVLLKWMLPGMGSGAAFAVGLKTSLAAALVESLPLKINDNVTVAITSAMVLSFLI